MLRWWQIDIFGRSSMTMLQLIISFSFSFQVYV
jgi:hypothetical protein